jgi:hypothetical protein
MAERIVGERQELQISRIAAPELGHLRARLFFTSHMEERRGEDRAGFENLDGRLSGFSA